MIPVALHVEFNKDIATSLKALLRSTPLPAQPILTSEPGKLGIDVELLGRLKQQFESEAWQVEDLERKINRWPNYMVRIPAKDEGGDKEEIDVHFIHVRSKRDDAIPLILLHGWPGTFWDFHKIIDKLTNPPNGQTAFHLVIPSLPGFFLSTYPQNSHWTLVDTARLFHRLMTRVLGYPRYAGHGGDWGSYILRVIGSLFSAQAPVLHFNMFRCPQLAGVDENSFTEGEKRSMARRNEFAKTGRGYYEIQSTKPFTIGLALASSPFGLLAYIGEKMLAWSDNVNGVLDPADILDTVALYYLSRSFATSVMIYNTSSPVAHEMSLTEKWKVQSKIGFTLFPYEIGASPRAYIEAVGPVMFYKERTAGGHFPALDNPQGLTQDLVEFVGGHWTPESKK